MSDAAGDQESKFVGRGLGLLVRLPGLSGIRIRCRECACNESRYITMGER